MRGHGEPIDQQLTTPFHRGLRTGGVGDRSDVGVGMEGGAFRLLFLLLLTSTFTVLSLLLQAIALQRLLLLKFGVIPLALDSANLIGLSSLGSFLHMVLVL